ncbi:MAG: T9SS type A sorting domain-containing protein, partial [Chitinophagales bacterium]
GANFSASSFTPTNDWIQIQAASNPNSITSFVEVIAASPNIPYDLTILDANSNSLSNTFMYEDMSGGIASIDIEQDVVGCGSTITVNLSPNISNNHTVRYYKEFYNSNSDNGGQILGLLGQGPHYFAETGTYAVVVSDFSTGCKTVETVHLPFEVSIEQEQNFCASSVVLNATQEDANSYFWSTGEVSPTIEVTNGGVYSVTISINDCALSEQVTASIETPMNQAAYTLTMDETWTTVRNIKGLMIVPVGKKLIIESTTIHFIDENSGILVQEGGYLRVDNAVLRGNSCVSSSWKGIQVEGQSDTAQPADYTTNGSTSHGTVIIRNGSTIQDAAIGILVQNTGGTGGGILSTRNSNFINNKIGIMMNTTSVGTELRGSIWENNFTTTAPFIGGGDGEYINVYLIRLGSPLNIFGNNFNCNVGMNVTGIRSVDSYLLSVFNNFENLYKGIDLYNSTTMPDIRINGNDFLATFKGVTLTNVPFASIFQNTFNIPNQTQSGDYPYGLFTFNSKGINVEDNTFLTASNRGTYGAIFRNETTGTKVLENTFAGNFSVATGFEQEDAGIELSCNRYVSNAVRDWYLGQNCYLAPQGECIGNPNGVAFQNEWNAGNTLNIVNDSPNILELEHAPGSEALNNEPANAVQQFLCSQFVSLCDGDDDNDDRNNVLLASRIREHLKKDEIQSALNLLISEGETWSNRLLVQAYIGMEDWTQAQYRVNLIPQNTPENLAFRDLYNMVINGTIGSKESAVRAYTNSSDTKVVTMAEALLANYFGDRYIRNPVAIPNGRNKKETNATESIQFKLIPNPAKDALNIHLDTSMLVEEVTIRIYNLQGKLWKKVKADSRQETIELSTNDLEQGVYIVELSNSKFSSVQKLSIIH